MLLLEPGTGGVLQRFQKVANQLAVAQYLRESWDAPAVSVPAMRETRFGADVLGIFGRANGCHLDLHSVEVDEAESMAG